jgi:hypothetical protein
LRSPRFVFVVIIDALLSALLIGVLVASFTVLATQWVAVAGAVVPILIYFVTASQGTAVRQSPDDRARMLAEQLAPQVWADWTAELPARDLDERRRIDVRWRLAAGSNPGARLALALPTDGVLSELTMAIASDVGAGGQPRLVLTGEVGGGKTAACILLVVELAEQRARLPVLFQLATWDSGTSVMDWMARQLPEIYPAVGGTRPDREVAALMVRRHILPILDGLDEVSDTATALKAIDDELAGRPFVLTCRTAEFTDANAGHVVHQAVIAELQPMTGPEVTAILAAYEPIGSDGPLETLISEITAHPRGSLARALSTPFMVSLVRATRVSAAELPTAPEDIHEYLLGAFVRQAYTHDEPLIPGTGPDRARVSPADAERYLRFLARQVDAAGRLAWWRLHLAVPRWWYLVAEVTLAATACAGLAAAGFLIFGHPADGFWIGFTAGAIGGVIVELIPPDEPRHAKPRFRSAGPSSGQELARTAGFGVMGAAALAAITLVLYRPVQYAVAGALLSGFTFALARYISRQNDPLKVVKPVSLLIADRLTVVYSWLVGAVPGALTGFYLGYEFHVGHRASLAGLTVLHYPALAQALLGALGGCMLSGAGLGLMAAGSSAWGRLLWTRVFLASRGDAPLLLITFLQDAYLRGVLRQVNGYYEFRHRLLQRYLRQPR